MTRSVGEPRRAGGRGLKVVIRGLQLVAVVVVAWFLYRALSGEIGRLSRADLVRWRPAAGPLVLSFVLLQAVYIAHALLWRTIVRDLGLGSPGLRDTLRIYFSAGLGKYVPGKVWALAGMAVLAGRAGLPPVASTAAAVIGQAAFMATGMVFLAITLPGWQEELGGSGSEAALLVVALMVGGVALWLLVASPAGRALRERLAARLSGGAGERLRSALRLADAITARSAAFWAFAYAATWVVLGLSFTLFVAAFSPTALESARYHAGTIAASLLVGYLLPLPAGIGSREAVMIVLLQPVVPQAGAALVISVLSRLAFTVAELLPLALLPLLPASEDRKA